MCYYSRTMRSSEYRDAKEGEDLTLRRDGTGHMVASGKDGLAVCVKSGTMINIEKLKLTADRTYTIPLNIRMHITHLIGKPVSTVFHEYHVQDRGYAADSLVIGGLRVHISWLAEGTKCYTGPVRPTIEQRLGVDDPSITLDHRPVEPTPTVERTLARIDGLCSITR